MSDVTNVNYTEDSNDSNNEESFNLDDTISERTMESLHRMFDEIEKQNPTKCQNSQKKNKKKEENYISDKEKTDQNK